jgi:subtilisin family serine protease
MKMQRITRRSLFIETLDPRKLLAWSGYAQLIDQDDADRLYRDNKGQGQTVAVIDTGIDYTHPALGGTFGQANSKVIAGYDFADNDADPRDTDGHGTSVAGMIAANRYTHNGVTYEGIAPQSKLVALRISRAGSSIADSTIERALQWVITNARRYNISSVNLSLGSGSYNSDFTNRTLSDEFTTLRNMNVVVVAASGNSGDSFFGGTGIAYPAADRNVLAVGSVVSNGSLSSFTQRNSMIDVLAPGEDVVSTSVGGGYTTIDGTSFASPIVAGVVALIKQIAPSLSVSDVSTILRTSSQTVRDSGDTNLQFGRVNVAFAIERTRQLTRNQSATFAASSSTVLASSFDQYGTQSVAYYDSSSRKVMYTTRLSSGVWSRAQLVDTGNADMGSMLSMAFDQSGKPVMAYYDRTNGDLRYASFNGKTFDIARVDSAGNTGQFVSLTIDRSGDTLISYYDASKKDLRLAFRNVATGQWTFRTLDSTGDVGASTSIAVGSRSDGVEVVAVAYADRTNGDLKYTRAFAGEAFETAVVDNLTGVANIHLTLDNGRAAIVYQDTTAADVKYAYRNINWFTETVASAGTVGQGNAVFYDSSNRLTIAYYDATNRATYLARRSTAGTWSSTKLADGGAQFALADRLNTTSSLTYLDRAGRAVLVSVIA